MNTPPQAPPAPPPSLRTRLLRHVLGPLALTWLVGTVASALLANSFTQRAFDRSLLDDAYAIAANVREGPDGLEFPLSSREVKAVLFDQVETVYFAVLREDGTLLAGNASLPAPPPHEGQVYRFSDMRFHGRALRAVRLQLATPAPFEVITAQTVHSRSIMLRSALLYSLASQVLLLVVLLASLLKTWNGVYFAGTRILYGLAGRGFLPRGLTVLHPDYGSPARIVLLIGAINIGGLLLGRGAVSLLVDTSASSIVFCFVVCCAALLVLRRRRSGAPDYLVPGGRAVILFALLAALAMAGTALVNPLLARGGVPVEYMILGGWTLIGWGLLRRWKASGGVPGRQAGTALPPRPE